MSCTASLPDPTDDSEAGLAAFEREVCAFLDAALTEDLRTAGRHTIGLHSEPEACRRWHRLLFERGWIAPSWPKAYGGTGWSARRRQIFDRLLAEHDAPLLLASGLRTIGPLLIEQGTEEQRRRYLPAILSGDDVWCQGFSEAQAGSDLAALALRAERIGGAYILNGAKLWTSSARFANRMYCLARTARSPRSRDGITFLLLDMDLPGLSARPIRTIGGDDDVHEVIFNNVRVPLSGRVGPEGGGWLVARRLMDIARASNTTSGLLVRAFRVARDLILGPATSPALGYRLSQIEMEIRAFAALELRMAEDAISAPESAVASMIKVAATELHQRLAELALDAGAYGATMPAGKAHLARYLETRGASIYAGTNELHRGAIARSILE